MRREEPAHGLPAELTQPIDLTRLAKSPTAYGFTSVGDHWTRTVPDEQIEQQLWKESGRITYMEQHATPDVFCVKKIVQVKNQHTKQWETRIEANLQRRDSGSTVHYAYSSEDSQKLLVEVKLGTLDQYSYTLDIATGTTPSFFMHTEADRHEYLENPLIPLGLELNNTQPTLLAALKEGSKARVEAYTRQFLTPELVDRVRQDFFLVLLADYVVSNAPLHKESRDTQDIITHLTRAGVDWEFMRIIMEDVGDATILSVIDAMQTEPQDFASLIPQLARFVRIYRGQDFEIVRDELIEQLYRADASRRIAESLLYTLLPNLIAQIPFVLNRLLSQIRERKLQHILLTAEGDTYSISARLETLHPDRPGDIIQDEELRLRDFLYMTLGKNEFHFESGPEHLQITQIYPSESEIPPVTITLHRLTAEQITSAWKQLSGFGVPFDELIDPLGMNTH